MKFLIDENIPKTIGDYILSLYPNSISVRGSDLVGSSDDQLYRYANEGSYIIITMDTDFSHIIRFPINNTPGRIVLRYRNIQIREMKNKVKSLFDQILKMDIRLGETLIVATNNKMRIRKEI